METQRGNTSTLTLLAGLGLGAAIMYFLDPGRGARRRHVVGDKAMSALRDGARDARKLAVNARNHVTGAVVQTRNRISGEIVDDIQLAERVRAQLGHHVEHARAIEVVAENGVVRLTGAIPPEEIQRAEKTACAVAGVQSVENGITAAPPIHPSAQG